jgi:hypothetical protein
MKLTISVLLILFSKSMERAKSRKGYSIYITHG